MQLEQMVQAKALEIQEDLSHVDNIHEMCFKVKVTGPVHRGDILIEYSMSRSNYSTEVTGYDINQVVEEFKRRNGWDRVNKPLCITHDGSNDSDIVAEDNEMLDEMEAANEEEDHPF